MKSRDKNDLTLKETFFLGALGITTCIPLALFGGAVYSVHQEVERYFSEHLVQRANVRGNDSEELFIDCNSKRFYAEVDGNPIERFLDNQ